MKLPNRPSERRCIRAAMAAALVLAPANLMTTAAHAQPSAGGSGRAIGTAYKNFSLPVSSSQGLPTAVVSGTEAQVVSANRIEIRDMKIDLLQDGKVTTVITSPLADFWEAERKLSTKNSVKIEQSNMTITAQDMNWELDNRRGTMRRNVEVVLLNLDMATVAPQGPVPGAGRDRPKGETPPPSEAAPSAGEDLPRFDLPAEPLSTPPSQ